MRMGSCWKSLWKGKSPWIGVLALASFAIATTAFGGECVEWEKICDEDGFCIDSCVAWEEIEEPFKVKTSGETAAPGTVGSDIEEGAEEDE